MFRKYFLSSLIVSLAALTVWGFAPGGATPAAASATPAVTEECKLRLTANAPSLTGPLSHPTSANVSWTINNVPPCYRISNIQITFNIIQRDGGNKQKIVNVSGNATSASAPLGLTVPEAEKPFPKNRPASITATVVATAVPIDNQIRGIDSETTEVTNR